MRKSLFTIGEEVNIRTSGESVTIFKCQYVKNMKRYSYVVNEYPNTFFFEEELTKEWWSNNFTSDAFKLEKIIVIQRKKPPLCRK